MGKWLMSWTRHSVRLLISLAYLFGACNYVKFLRKAVAAATLLFVFIGTANAAFCYLPLFIQPNGECIPFFTLEPVKHITTVRPTEHTLKHGTHYPALHDARVHGPWTRVLKMTPLFTDRVHGPWTRRPKWCLCPRAVAKYVSVCL